MSCRSDSIGMGSSLPSSDATQLDFFEEPKAHAPGFNNSSKCLTDTLADEDNRFLCSPNDLEQWQRDIYFSCVDETSVGVTVNIYPSGEISSGYFSPKRPSLKPKGAKRGKRCTEDLTDEARKKIRRVGRNIKTPFITMLTLTFDPKIAELNEDGTVNHDYANKEKERFLNTLSKKYARLAEVTGKPEHQLEYTCVAEIQPQTGNIHYHMLTNKYFNIRYLLGIWKQSSNSVDVKKLKGDSLRCIRYLLKYVTKEQKINPYGNRIYGNRYSISQGLRDEAKPETFRACGAQYRRTVQTYIDKNVNSLLHGKGFVCDYGFWVPPPSRQKDGLKNIEQLEFLFGIASELAQSGDDTLLLHLLTEGYGNNPDKKRKNHEQIRKFQERKNQVSPNEKTTENSLSSRCAASISPRRDPGFENRSDRRDPSITF